LRQIGSSKTGSRRSEASRHRTKPPGTSSRGGSRLRARPSRRAKRRRSFLSDADRLERRGRTGRAQAVGLTWDSRAEKIEAFAEACLARDPASRRETGSTASRP
jgi:hypothetical protein